MSEIQNQNTEQNNKLVEYEKICKTQNEKIIILEKSLEQRDDQISALKHQLNVMEEEAQQLQKLKVQRAKETEEMELIKNKSENTLVRAKSIIFEKTKVIENQELQIQALNQQIESLRDVVAITKDLLEIRNLEVKQLEAKIEVIENRVKAERERQELVHKKLENMIRYNGELKREYETQLCLFSALRERYNERELARGVVEELEDGENVENKPLENGSTDVDGAGCSKNLPPNPEETKENGNKQNES